MRVVLRCQYSTFTEHETHQTSDVNMKYSKEHNKRQCPDHRQTFAANRPRSQARATPPDVNCFITRPKSLRVPYTQYGFSSRVPCFWSCSCVWLYILLCNRWLIQYGANAVVGKLFSDVGTPRVSFVLPSSVLISSSFFFLLLSSFFFFLLSSSFFFLLLSSFFFFLLSSSFFFLLLFLPFFLFSFSSSVSFPDVIKTLFQPPRVKPYGTRPVQRR